MNNYQSQPIRFSTYVNGTNGKDGDNGLTPEIKDGYWWIGNTNTNVKAEGLDGTDGVSFSGVVEYYYATLADNKDGYPTKTEDGKQVVDLTEWYDTIEETKFGTKVIDGINEGKTYKYLWNVEGVQSTGANDTLRTDYTNPELVQVYLGGRIPAEYISYYASSHDSDAPGLQPSVSTDGNSLTIENNSSWSTTAEAPDSNNYLFEITFVKYTEKDENGKNLYAKMSGPTIIGHSGADAMTLELDNDSDVIAKTANGTVLGTTNALSVVNASVVKNGVKVTDASVQIYSKPDNFVNNTNYSFANNTLTIKSLPTGFSSGKFVFTYNNLYATYNLSVALAENDYNLIIPKSVINSTDDGGDIEIKVEKISADGTSETITASDEVEITYSGSTNISKSGWTFSYQKGESTPLQLTLKDKTGSFVWDTETIEFVHNGSDGTSPYSISFDKPFALISTDNAGTLTADWTIEITPTIYYGSSEVTDWSTTQSGENLELNITSADKLTWSASGKKYTITWPKSATGDEGTITFTLNKDGDPVTTNTFVVKKQKAGPTGPAAKDFNVTASSYITKKDADGNYSSVTLTAHPINLGDPVINWYKDGGSTASASGDTYTATSPGIYEARIDGTNWKDSVEIKEVLDGTSGTDAIAVVLSNSFITFNSGLDQSEQCKIEVYEGGEALTYNSSATDETTLQNGQFFRGKATDLEDNVNSDTITIPTQSEPGRVEVGLTIKTKDGTVLTNRTASINWTVVDNGEPAVTRYFTLTPDFINREAPETIRVEVYEYVGNGTPGLVSGDYSYNFEGEDSGDFTNGIFEILRLEEGQEKLEPIDASTKYLQLTVYKGKTTDPSKVAIGSISIEVKDNPKTDYFLYHDKTDNGEKPALPTELNYGEFPTYDENGWYTEQQSPNINEEEGINYAGSWYYCNKQGAYTSLEQATLPWHGPEYINPQPITYNDMWGALNTAVEEEKNNNSGLKVGVYPFTVGEGESAVKCLGINADLIKTGALCVGNAPNFHEDTGVVTNWNNNVLYAAMDTPQDGTLPLVHFAGWKAEPGVLSSADGRVQLRTDNSLQLDGYDAPVSIAAATLVPLGKKFYVKLNNYPKNKDPDKTGLRVFDIEIQDGDNTETIANVYVTNEYQQIEGLFGVDSYISSITRYIADQEERVWEQQSNQTRFSNEDDITNGVVSPTSDDLIYKTETINTLVNGTYILNDGTLIAEKGKLGALEINNTTSSNTWYGGNLFSDNIISAWNPTDSPNITLAKESGYRYLVTNNEKNEHRAGLAIGHPTDGKRFFEIGKRYTISFTFQILEFPEDETTMMIGGHSSEFTDFEAWLDGEKVTGNYAGLTYKIEVWNSSQDRGILFSEHTLKIVATARNSGIEDNPDYPGFYIQPQRFPDEKNSDRSFQMLVSKISIKETNSSTVTTQNTFSWHLSPTEGVFMWSGARPNAPANTKTKDAVFAIYNNGSISDPDYQLSMRGHIEAESGQIGGWNIGKGAYGGLFRTKMVDGKECTLKLNPNYTGAGGQSVEMSFNGIRVKDHSDPRSRYINMSCESSGWLRGSQSYASDGQTYKYTFNLYALPEGPILQFNGSQGSAQKFSNYIKSTEEGLIISVNQGHDIIFMIGNQQYSLAELFEI